jgi:AcrR family transcriptional regulator
MSATEVKGRGPGRPRQAKGHAGGSTREDILDAAEEVVAALGAQCLTLDAVYKQAGVSKGGLLYHFPSKEALIDGMVERYLQRSFVQEADLKQEICDDGARGDLDARATIAHLAADDPGADRLSAALLAAVANDLDRLAPVRVLMRQRFQALNNSALGFETAAVIELAVSGLGLLELLRLTPLGLEDRRRVLAHLDRLAGGTGDLPQAGSRPTSPLTPTKSKGA